MAVGDPISGVGIGLGRKPPHIDLALAGRGGTAVFHFDAQHTGSLIGAHGQIIPKLHVDFPIDPVEQRNKTVNNSRSNVRNNIAVTLTGVRVLKVEPVGGGAVEVTVQYQGVQKSPPGTNRAVATKGVSGN